MRVGLLHAFLVVICFVAGCGKKGELKYPEYFAPESVSDLRAKREGVGAVIVWTSPRETASGKKLKDLSYYIIQRAPFSQRPRDYDFDDIARISVDTGKEAREGPISYEYRDSKVLPNGDFQYKVIPVNTLDIEGVSSIVTLEHLPVSSLSAGDRSPVGKKVGGTPNDNATTIEKPHRNVPDRTDD